MTSPAKASVTSSAAGLCIGMETAAISMIRRRDRRGSCNDLIVILVLVSGRVESVRSQSLRQVGRRRWGRIDEGRGRGEPHGRAGLGVPLNRLLHSQGKHAEHAEFGDPGADLEW